MKGNVVVLILAAAAFFGFFAWSEHVSGILGLLVLGSAPVGSAAAIGLGVKSLEWWAWRKTPPRR